MGLRKFFLYCFNTEYRQQAWITHHLFLAHRFLFSTDTRFRGYMQLQEAEGLLEHLAYPDLVLEARAEKLSRLYAGAFARELRRAGYYPFQVDQEITELFCRKL